MIENILRRPTLWALGLYMTMCRTNLPEWQQKRGRWDGCRLSGFYGRAATNGRNFLGVWEQVAEQQKRASRIKVDEQRGKLTPHDSLSG